MDTAPADTFQDLSARIVDLCGRIHGAEFQLLDLIHRIDALKTWTGALPSCAHWLVWRCGMDIVTAREKVRVAHALVELPRVRDKFRSGELSYSKVRAITRIAEPSTEDEWVDTALGHTAAQLERIVRQHRQTHCLDAPGAALEAWKHRHFDYHLQPDGSLVFEGRVPAEVGAMLLQAMDRALEWLDADARAEGASAEAHCHEGCGGQASGKSGRYEGRAGDDSEESRLDSASEVDAQASRDDSAESCAKEAAQVAAAHGDSAELFLGAGADADTGPPRDDSTESSLLPPAARAAESPGITAERAPAAGSDRPNHAARRADALGLLAERFLSVAPEAAEGLQTADRFLLTVHAPVSALPLRARVDPTDPPVLEHGPVLANDTVRRIGCDAALVRVIESGDGEPLDVGRKTRVIPPAIRRALKRRDGGCRFPGCTHTKFVDGHHIVHWADGGATRLDNLVSVCRHHHRLLHEGGYTVVKRDAEFIFFRGDGLRVPEVNDRLQPGELDAEFGQDATALCRGGDRGALPPASLQTWRLARTRGFGRSRSRQRAEWEAFSARLQR